MAQRRPFTPNFKTPQSDLCKEELNKVGSNMIRGNVRQEFHDESRADLSWETEALAKSHGIYLEFNRAKTGTEKDWMYLIRISIPGGGPLNRHQWNLIDDLSEKYTKDPDGVASIRLTTRQNIQFHWVSKKGVIDIVKTIAETGYNSLNGCGDNTRNVMACPLSRFSDVFNGNAWAHKAGTYFQLPVEPFIEVWAIDPKNIRKPEESFQYSPQLLNRKFKIGFSAVHRNAQTGQLYNENCVEVLTNDMGVAPVIRDNKISGYQIYIGGGQGERNGKPAMACLAQPVAIVDEARLLKVMDALVHIHEEWGDRQNRQWARIKYLVKSKGIPWFREQLKEHLGWMPDAPDATYDVGPRDLHFGWTLQPSNGLWSYGAFIETGRIQDESPNGKLKSMMRAMVNKYPVDVLITPNQDALFTNIPEAAKHDFENDLRSFGWGKRNGQPYSKLRTLSGACVGRDTCRLTYTDSERFIPKLIDELDKLGWGDMTESIGVTGCERQCFRPSTKTIGFVGSGMDRYQMRLMGSEDARFQGGPIIGSDDQMYLRMITPYSVVVVFDNLFNHYKANARAGESLGTFNRRVGMDYLIKMYKDDPATSELMAKTYPTDCVID
ncbi:MAG: nitrite/sulfite reductase [Candidatus Omnitrophica bacterium]|nr:nitrite/sulfite reductase [Candidatus Omnitrophota bacterium]